VNSTVEELDDNRVKVSVEVAESELEPAIAAAFKKIAKQVRLPGFRPGKAPRRVIESHFGKGVARGQAIEDAIPDYFLAAVAEHEVDFIDGPEYDITSGMDEGDLLFDAVVPVRPSVNVAGYENLRVEITNPTPTDEEIDAQVDVIRGQFSELETVERAAESGDHLTLDIATSHDGEAVEGLTATDYVYELGTGGIVPEFDDNLEGSTAGTAKSFQAEHPDPDTEGELSFEVTVKEVQARILPDLDDAFVADATEFATVEEFREDTRSRLTVMKTGQANQQLSEHTGRELSKLVGEDLPTQLVESEKRNRLEDMALRMQQQGIDFGQYLQITGASVEDMLAQLQEPAEEAVRVDLALRAVAAAEGLEATEADLEEEFGTWAEQTGGDVEALREQVRAANQMVAVRSDLGKRKAVEWLLERVEIVDEAGDPIDRTDLEMPEEEHDHDHADHDHDHADHDHDDQDHGASGDQETSSEEE